MRRCAVCTSDHRKRCAASCTTEGYTDALVRARAHRVEATCRNGPEHNVRTSIGRRAFGLARGVAAHKCSTQRARRNVQQATCNKQHMASNNQRDATFNKRGTTCNMRQASAAAPLAWLASRGGSGKARGRPVPCPAHLARSRTSRSQPRRTLVVGTASPPVQAETAAVAHCAQSCEAAWSAAQQSVTAGEREKRR